MVYTNIRRYRAKILPIRRKTQDNQLIKHLLQIVSLHLIIAVRLCNYVFDLPLVPIPSYVDEYINKTQKFSTSSKNGMQKFKKYVSM